jgi:hypothetical protein
LAVDCDAAIAKPGMAYPETNTLKSTRPVESGDLRRG